MGRGAFAYIVQLFELPREIWATQRAFLLSYQERAGGSRAGSAVQAFSLCANAQDVCRIGLHLLAAEDGAGSSDSQSPDLRDMCKYGCPESPDWDSYVESWTDSEGSSSSEHCEHNVECLALNVLGQDRSGEKISLSSWKIGNLRRWL